MTSFVSRAFNWSTDKDRAIALLNHFRDAGNVMYEPHLWRFLMLMTSRLWKPEHEAQFWTDQAGNTTAFAMLNSREAHSSTFGLEQIIHPNLTRHSEDRSLLQDLILSWATTYVQQRTVSQQQEMMLYISVPETIDNDFISHLDSFGFRRYMQGHNVYLTADLTFPPAAPADNLEGFMIRALKDAELDTYDELFGFTAVNRSHRHEQLYSNDYKHFVAIVADGSQAGGKMVGYGECSFSRTEWQRSGRRVGWLDYIGVQDEYVRQGLGGALVAAALNHLAKCGTETVQLITANSNVAALQLYQKFRFVITSKEYIYKNVYTVN